DRGHRLPPGDQRADPARDHRHDGQAAHPRANRGQRLIKRSTRSVAVARSVDNTCLLTLWRGDDRSRRLAEKINLKIHERIFAVPGWLVIDATAQLFADVEQERRAL